jgi:hypothetical protein
MDSGLGIPAGTSTLVSKNSKPLIQPDMLLWPGVLAAIELPSIDHRLPHAYGLRDRSRRPDNLRFKCRRHVS